MPLGSFGFQGSSESAWIAQHRPRLCSRAPALTPSKMQSSAPPSDQAIPRVQVSCSLSQIHTSSQKNWSSTTAAAGITCLELVWIIDGSVAKYRVLGSGSSAAPPSRMTNPQEACRQGRPVPWASQQCSSPHNSSWVTRPRRSWCWESLDPGSLS